MAKNPNIPCELCQERAFVAYGRKLKKLTSALVGCARIKHDRLVLNDMSVERGEGPVFTDLDEWNEGFDSGAMLLFDRMLTPAERAVGMEIAHDAAGRFAEVGVCPAPIFVAMVFDKMSKSGISKLERFCDPDFCVAWDGGDGKHYCVSMGKWASEHAGTSVYKALLAGELEHVCFFGLKGDRKCLARSFKWDDDLGDMP